MKINITLDTNSKTPIYLQIVQSISYAIKVGKLSPGIKLPGSRILAAEFKLHRKTVVAALDELVAQGWLIAKPNVGTFVNENFPIIDHLLKGDLQEQDLTESNHSVIARKTSFNTPNSYLFDKLQKLNTLQTRLIIDRGAPDNQFLPRIDWTKIVKKYAYNYSNDFARSENRRNYRLQKWQQYFEEIKHLKLNITEFLTCDHIYQSIELITQYLWQKPIKVVVSSMGDGKINGFLQALNHLLIPINFQEEQYWIEKLDTLAKSKEIDIVLIQPDYQYPSTQVLSINKRLHLIELANKYHFKIIEIMKDNDFNFDIHLPPSIISLDQYGNTITIGDLEHLIGKETSVSFIIAPENLIYQLEKLKNIISPSSSNLIANGFAAAFADGTILKTIKKAAKVYNTRLKCWTQDSSFIQNNFFNIMPTTGGLGMWIKTNPALNLTQFKTALSAKHYFLPDELIYQSKSFSGIRIGYASIKEEEIFPLQEAMLTVAPWCVKENK